MLFVISCNKDFFRTNQVQNKVKTPPIEKSENLLCSEFTTIRPQVDLLFLWDNSTSTIFINPATKNALNRVVETISERFDYHILLAPLIGTGMKDVSFLSLNTKGLDSNIANMRIDKANAANALNFPSGGANAEKGLQRTSELLSSNISNGVFRKNAYTIVVLMSNQTDNSYITSNKNAKDRLDYFNKSKHEILCIRGNYSGACTNTEKLDSQMMRFISIVAQDIDGKCSSSSINGFDIGMIYEMMSSHIYAAPYTNGIPSPTDQVGAKFISRGGDDYSLFDSYDICNEDYDGIFDGVNNAIQDTVLHHSYRFWPLAAADIELDPASIKITRNDGVTFNPIDYHITINRDKAAFNDTDKNSGSTLSGFRYHSNTTENTRFLPNLGEPYTGHLIELFGDAKITFPSCYKVEFTAPKDYYGYVHLQFKPLANSIILKINGIDIPKSTTNGWELMVDTNGAPEHFDNKNIKIKSSNDDTEENPAVLKTGYFLKLYGNAIYSNDAQIDAVYDPQS